MSGDPVIRVTVEDLATGDREEVLLPAGTYLVTTTHPCHVSHEQHYPKSGTVSLTIKGVSAERAG